VDGLGRSPRSFAIGGSGTLWRPKTSPRNPRRHRRFSACESRGSGRRRPGSSRGGPLISPSPLIVIPAYNEAESIGALLRLIAAVPTETLGFDKEIIVVDDGSRTGPVKSLAASPA